jgi:hypothetical protein
MPYSNQRRHNSPSIPQTPYQTLIIPCPNFDPIYQVVLLENFNEWNLSPAKEGSLKKKRKKERKRKTEQGLNSKRGETSYEEARCFKKKRMKYKLLEEIPSKDRKEITFSYSEKSNVWPHPYPHIICICTTFYSLTFPFITHIHYTILHQP